MEEFSYKDIEAATGGFAVDRLIGKGSHGSVYEGRLKGGKLVAVKKPTSVDGSKVANEIDILASVKGPSVVNLLGVCRSPASPASSKLLVMEFMPNGSLHDLLHSSPDPPTWPWRAAMAMQIARAVLALHEAAPSPVIHRDIKSANILLDRHRNARLADFSLAVRADTASSPDRAAVPAGTIGYLDPCYTESAKLGPENDVFSFGVVLLELMSARKVIDTGRDPASIVAWAVPLIRDRRSSASAAAEVCDRRVALPGSMAGPIGRLLSVAAQCVSESVECRPSMAAVVRELKGAVEGLWWPFREPVSCCEAYRRAYRCVRGWRRRVKKRVAASRLWGKGSEESL